MFASPFEISLLNLCQLIPKQSLYYMTTNTAKEELMTISGEDFGLDAKRWEQWGVENRSFMTGWQGLDAIIKAYHRDSPASTS